MADIDAQQLNTFQTAIMPKPTTIASAATIAPSTFLTFITGTAQLQTITPFVSGAHLIMLVFTNAAPGAFLTTGNIQRAFTPLQNNPVLLAYDPGSNKYWVLGYAS